MFEKVSKFHPDKLADRIAGALVDLAYTKQIDPKIAVEVLLGHDLCTIIIEASVMFTKKEIKQIVYRIVGKQKIKYKQVPQDVSLANNQKDQITCGDNGIFLGVPVTSEQKLLVDITKRLESKFRSDGKYLIANNNIIICQSCALESEIRHELADINYNLIINPLGFWTGGTNVDTGATNRKLGSDMADSVTGGGIQGKDFSKADVSVNIFCFLKAQELKKAVKAYCAIGDTVVNVNGEKIPYLEIVHVARNYIRSIGGFEKFAEHGLVF